MKMKEKIIAELKKSDFPNLEFLFSSDALTEAPELLKELLEKEKKEFEEFLQKPNSEITFESFDDEGLLDYYWSLLNHYQNVNNTEEMRKIIDDFRPELQDFGNYVAYNQNLYEKTKYCLENCELDNDQKRALELRMKGFQDR
jgi:Zn-dependent oligopeptidase